MSTPETAIATVPDRAAAIATEHKLPIATAASLWSAFGPHFRRFDEVKASAASVKPGSVKIARSIRLEVKGIRVAAEKTRKELKEDSLRTGKAIDAFNNILLLDLKPVEDALEEIEKAEERAEAARKEKLKTERIAALEPYTSTEFFDLANMPEPEWQQLLATSQAAHENRLAEQERARAERAAAEQAAEAERKRVEQEQAAERERLRIENQRLAAIAAQEKEARAQAEAEAKRLADIERAKQEAEAAKVREEQEAARRAAAAPDAEKLKAFAATIRTLTTPSMSTERGQWIATDVANSLRTLAEWIDQQISDL